MKVLIIEDEIMAQKSLTRLINQNFPDIEILGYTSSIRDSVQWLKERGTELDVIFMDVELSDGKCFEIFRQVDIKVQVIMTTAYDSYALKAFEAGTIDYLLKPIEAAALKRAVSRCRADENHIKVEELLKAFGGNLAPKKEYKERYIVRFNDRIIPIPTSNIAYVYSEEKNNYLVTFEDKHYIIDSSLDVISDELDSESFFRISRSCIIAMKAIDSIIKQQGGRLKVASTPKSNFELTVSRSRVDDFLKWLEK